MLDDDDIPRRSRHREGKRRVRRPREEDGPEETGVAEPEPHHVPEPGMYLRISRHALGRVREHHPQATPRWVAERLIKGVEVSQAMALSLLGRRFGKTNSAYILSDDRRGLYVMIPNEGTVVTYIRFGTAQVRFALEHWPLGSTG